MIQGFLARIVGLLGSLCALCSIPSCRPPFENFVIIICELRDDQIVILLEYITRCIYFLSFIYFNFIITIIFLFNS